MMSRVCTVAGMVAFLIVGTSTIAAEPTMGAPGILASAPVANLADALVWTFNESVFTPAEVDKAAYVGPQYCKRAWFKYSGIPYDFFADPALNMGRLPLALNDRGALFEGGVQVSDIHQSAGWPVDSAYDDDHRPPFEIPDPVFEDFATRDADGNLHPMGTIYGFGDEFHASIANENYRDFVLFWAEEQIDRNVNALEFDVISGGYGISASGAPGNNANEGYEDYAIGTANLAASLSVAYARGTTEPVRFFMPSATASSALQPAAAAFDNDAATWWLSNDVESVHTLEVDFGRDRTVQQLVVEFPAGRKLATFRLERWSGSTGWEDFAPAVALSENQRLSVSFLVDPVITSKVRLVTSEKQAAVAELRIFGAGFRQYLLARYGRDLQWAPDDSRWMTVKRVDLRDPLQCPDGTMNSFNYRRYLAARGWTGNPFGGPLDPAHPLEAGNPLFLDWFPERYFKALDAPFRLDPQGRREVQDAYLASFSARRSHLFWKSVVDAVRAYAAAKGRPLFVTANGVAPYADYVMTGEATSLLFPAYPAPSAGDPDGTALDGRQAQIGTWRSIRDDDRETRRLLASPAGPLGPPGAADDVPVVAFLDFGYDGMPFHHLGGADGPADQRINYLRTYPMEAYAAGVRFCFPVRANEENSWADVASDGTRVIDVIKQQTEFLSAHGEIYREVAADPQEALVTVNGLVPFNGRWNVVGGKNDSRVNGSKVTVAYTRRRDGTHSYLHVINHAWDGAASRMVPQIDVPITVPVTVCSSVRVVSPDLEGEVELPFASDGGVVSLRLPRLSFYAVIVFDHARVPRRHLTRQ